MVKKSEERVAIVRTSDRGAYRGCRRSWGWSSHLRGNRGIIESYLPFWLGSGIHYALEDYHGYNLFGNPVDAFKGFIEAYRRTPKLQLPEEWSEAKELGIGMLEYYLLWLENRDPLKTYWEDGQPQVEVRAQIPIPFETPHFDKVVYDFTIDRVVEDEHGRLWLLDYKTAKQFIVTHLPTDSQITSYTWGGNYLYDRPIEGMIYQQHKKTVPDEPLILQSGRLSINKAQATTRILYRQSLINLYGDTSNAPEENVEFLNYLAHREFEDADAFIRRDWVERNKAQCEAESVKILQELEEMLNPDLPLYPSPNRFCGSCFFEGPCVSMDAGDDWEHELELTTKPRSEERDLWRKHLRP